MLLGEHYIKAFNRSEITPEEVLGFFNRVLSYLRSNPIENQDAIRKLSRVIGYYQNIDKFLDPSESVLLKYQDRIESLRPIFESCAESKEDKLVCQQIAKNYEIAQNYVPTSIWGQIKRVLEFSTKNPLDLLDE